MAVIETIVCDVCGIKKGESNHWMLWRTDETIPGPHGALGGISFAPWHPELFRTHRHLCGESCAARLLARSIDEWRELQEAARPPAVDPYRLNTNIH